MDYYVMEVNVQTGKTKVVNRWTADDSAACDAHYLNVANQDEDIRYMTCPSNHLDTFEDDVRKSLGLEVTV